MLSSFLASFGQPCRGYQLPKLLTPRRVCWLCHHRQWLWLQLLSSSLEGTTSATLGVCLCESERSISGG